MDKNKENKSKKKGFAFIPFLLPLLGGSFPLFIGVGLIGLGFFLYSAIVGDPNNGNFNGGETLSGCGISADYATVFNNAAKNYSTVSPALIAAIFYAGEHSKNWPPITGDCTSGSNCEGGWKVSPSNAKGPFQFTEETWTDYGKPLFGDYNPNAFDINKAATAAANMLEANIKSNSANVEKKLIKRFESYPNNPDLFNPADGKIIRAIQRYNSRSLDKDSSDPYYIPRVYEQYLTFKQCVKKTMEFAGGSFIQTCQGGSASSNGKVIVIDAGHGTTANRKTNFEMTDNYETANLLKNYLQSKGYTVYLTHDSLYSNDASYAPVNTKVYINGQNSAARNKYLDNHQRAEIANNYNAALILHIHSDAGKEFKFCGGYPKKTNVKDQTGSTGPVGGQAVVDASTKFAGDLYSSLKSAGFTPTSKCRSGFVDTAVMSPGTNLYAYDQPLKAAAGFTLEMFQHSVTSGPINQSALDFRANKNGIRDKMVAAIGSAVEKYAGSNTSGGTNTVSSQTGSCKIANFALQTIKDVTEKDGCKDKKTGMPDGCASGKKSDARYRAISSNGVEDSDYYKATSSWYLKSYKPARPNYYADCSHFVGYVVKTIADPDFPRGGSQLEFDYVQSKPDKYEMIPNTGTNTKPGDILFLGSCNSDVNNGSLVGIDGIRYECSYGTKKGFGHVAIYVGENSLYPGNYIYAQSSYGNFGPKITDYIDGSMGVIARPKF